METLSYGDMACTQILIYQFVQIYQTKFSYSGCNLIVQKEMDYHALTFSCKQQRIVMIGSLTTVMLLKATQVPKYTLKNAVFQMVIIYYLVKIRKTVTG